MRFEWFVAQRYLRSPYRPPVLRLVTLLSVLGVAAGVATLVIALSMNTGFRETLQDRLLGVTAHISLTRPGSGGIKNYEEMARKLGVLPGVRSVTPAVYQTVLLSFAGQARGVVTKGIDPERERKSDEALERVVSGKLDFSPDPDGIEALLIGKQLAEEWKISPGDYVTITSPQGRLTAFGLITFVAGLNILVVLSMTVTDKARDIAVLRSLGARREQIRKVFLWQGISIGAVGTLAGLTLGYAFSFISGSYHLIPLDPQVYAVPYVPFHPSLFDGLWITAVAMGIHVGAPILPAPAGRALLPVEILRFE